MSLPEPASAEGVLILDDAGRIASVDPRAAALFGYDAGTLAGASLEQLLEGWDPASGEREACGRRSDGDTFTAEVVRIPLPGIDVARTVLFVRDVTNARHAELQRHLLASIVESAEVAIVGKSLDGHILSWNRGAERLWGWSGVEAVGRSVYELVPEDFYAEEAELFRRIEAGEQIETYEGRILRKDGRTVEVSKSLSPIRDADGRIVGASVILVDVTERRRREALERETRELIRSNEALEDFASVVAHDLREPLRMVAGYMDLLQRRHSGDLPAEARELVDTAVEGSHRMAELIEALLAYARVGGRADDVRTDADTALDGALGALARPLRESGAEVLRGPLPQVPIDRLRLTQVFQNLLGNALKFRSEARRPEIRVSARRDGDTWVFEVRDNGIGIPPEAAGRIFDLFFQVSAEAGAEGVGIGLPIVRRIVEDHGGRIWVESAPGRGTTFRFTLPALRDDRAPSPRGTGPGPRPTAPSPAR